MPSPSSRSVWLCLATIVAAACAHGGPGNASRWHEDAGAPSGGADDGDDAGGDDASASQAPGDLFDAGGGGGRHADSGGATTPDDSTCAAQSTLDSCIGCCQADHAAGFDVLKAAAVECLCGSGPCASACASEYCANQSFQAGDDCDHCISDNIGAGSTCGAPIDDACNAAPSCASYRECVAARCAGKQ